MPLQIVIFTFDLQIPHFGMNWFMSIAQQTENQRTDFIEEAYPSQYYGFWQNSKVDIT